MISRERVFELVKQFNFKVEYPFLKMDFDNEIATAGVNLRNRIIGFSESVLYESELLIKYIIGHEYGHVCLYKKYDNEKKIPSSYARECFCDLLSIFILALTDSYSKEEIILELKKYYADNPYEISDVHPANIQRAEIIEEFLNNNIPQKLVEKYSSGSYSNIDHEYIVQFIIEDILEYSSRKTMFSSFLLYHQ